jgi:hypothetical protein
MLAETGCLAPAMIAAEVAVTRGKSNVNAVSVGVKRSGVGNIVWGVFCRTAPLNHLFVGGRRPFATCVVSIPLASLWGSVARVARSTMLGYWRVCPAVPRKAYDAATIPIMTTTLMDKIRGFHFIMLLS